MFTIIEVIIAIIIAFVLYIIFKPKNQENFDNPEGLTNISAVYNTDNLVVQNLIVNGAFNMVPRGCVVAWNNPTIPKGWAICDGGNGTPDLRGRFILGAGQGEGISNRPFNQKGGAETHTLNENEIPEHSHGTFYYGATDYMWAIVLAGKECSNVINQVNAPFAYSDNKPIKGDTVVSQNVAHNNMPPFFVLYYIMKL